MAPVNNVVHIYGVRGKHWQELMHSPGFVSLSLTEHHHSVGKHPSIFLNGAGVGGKRCIAD